MSLLALVVLSIFFCQAHSEADDSSIVLTDVNFNDQIMTSNYFVSFVKNRPYYEFDAFWEKIMKSSNSPNSHIKFARVECEKSPKTCQEQSITEPLSVVFFRKDGDSFDPKPMATFFESMIEKAYKEAAREDKMLMKLSSGNYIVKFFTQKCPNCKAIAPVWAEVVEPLNGKTDFEALSIDCNEFWTICKKYKVESYPRISWIKSGKEMEILLGDKTKQNLESFVKKISENLPLTVAKRVRRSAVKPKKESIELSSKLFKKTIAKGFTFVKFFYTWCSHCKKVNKVWDDLVGRFENDSTLQFGHVDCDDHGSLCSREANGCPTLNLYHNGEKILDDYYEDFSLESLVDCVASNVKGGDVVVQWKIREKEKHRLRKLREKQAKEAEKKEKEEKKRKKKEEKLKKAKDGKKTPDDDDDDDDDD